MAQRAQDPHSAYPVADHFTNIPFGHMQMPGSNLLDGNEQNFMTDFFNNPDQAIDQHNMCDDGSFGADGYVNPFIYMAEARAHTNESPDHSFYNSNGNFGASSDVQNAASALMGTTHNANDLEHGSWGNVSTSNPAISNFQPHRVPGQQQQQQNQGAVPYPFHDNSLFQAPPTWQQPVHSGQVPFQQPPRARHLSIDTQQSPLHLLQHHSMQGVRSALPDSQHRPAIVAFGSDNNFSQNGYQAPLFQRVKDRSGDLLNMPLAAQAAAAGAYSSSSSTPTRQTDGSVGHQYNGSRASQSGLPTPTSAQNAASWGSLIQHPGAVTKDEDNAQDSLPRKRRKADNDDGYDGVSELRSKVQAQPQDDEYTPNSAGLAKRRKSAHARIAGNSPHSPTSSGAEDEGDDQPSSSRKKDKKPRQNLSDTQKRQNHIMSEKKRRELIKTGYADLNELVPALYGGKTGMSRSESLFECQTYLESLIMGSRSIMHALNIDANHAALVNIRTTSDFAVKSENNYIE